MSNINKPQTKLVNDDQQFNSNSLERNYNQRQYLVNNQTVNCTNYSQSPHRNSLSISLRSPTSSSRLMTHHHHQQQQSKMINETINENGSYLMSSSASSNDIISINSNQSSVQQQQQQLKIELDNARNRILTLTNQLNTNVSVYYV